MGREDGETGAGRLVLVGSAEGPEGNGSTTELSEPRLKLRLGRVVGQAAHVEDLAALREEGSDISVRIHRLGQHVRVFLGRLALADEASKDAGQGNSFFHRAAGRSGS
jgi:hypothetical protein